MLEQREVSLLLDLAGLACHKGFVGQARGIAESVLADKEDFVPAKILLAHTHLVVDDYEGALALLEPILAANPSDCDALVLQGLALLMSDRRVEAQESFGRIPDGAAQKRLAQELLQVF